MIFNRTYKYRSTRKTEDLKSLLLDSSIEVKNQSFFISDRGDILRIIPDAENRKDLTTLPVTHINMRKNGNDRTELTLFSKPRKIDAGGPYLVVIFCLFLLIAAGVIYYVDPTKENYIPVLGLVALSVIGFVVFWIRMQMGYFDYVKGINKEIEKLI